MCVIREQMILQIILAWSRLTRGWGGLGSFYSIFSCLKSDTKNCVIFFYLQTLLEVFDKVTFGIM